MRILCLEREWRGNGGAAGIPRIREKRGEKFIIFQSAELEECWNRWWDSDYPGSGSGGMFTGAGAGIASLDGRERDVRYAF